MKYITAFASGFMGLFQTGAKTFIGWMSSIVPVVLLLLVLMNTIIAYLGEERASIFAKCVNSLYDFAIFISVYVRQSDVIYHGTVLARILQTKLLRGASTILSY